MYKYLTYDTIISRTYSTIYNNSTVFDIILNDFQKDNPIHKVFLKVAFMISYIEDREIYLKCSFFDFLQILFNNYTIRQILKGNLVLRRATHNQSQGIDIESAATIIAKSVDQELSIYEEIWEEYYNDKKGEKNV